jgi:hypothetical protein
MERHKILKQIDKQKIYVLVRKLHFVFNLVLTIIGILKGLKYISLIDEDDGFDECSEVFQSTFLIIMVFYYISIDWRLQLINMSLIILMDVIVLGFVDT